MAHVNTMADALIVAVLAAAIYSIDKYYRDPSLLTVRFKATNVVLLVTVQGTRVELRGWFSEIA